MKLDITSRVRLNNGIMMPWLGLGVWQMPGRIAEKAVKSALKTGYRLIDTARIYGNEEEVGLAIKESGIKREDVFVTSKVWNDDHGYEETLRACNHSLRLLGLKHVDLYLVHWPGGGKREETWKAMERILIEGKARAIGVSNYTIGHLEELFGYTEVPPAVNQVEFSPYLYQKDLMRYCTDKGIQLEAYSPLTHGRMLGDPRLLRLGQKYGKSPAQVLIRWCLQSKVVAIPKSAHPERIEENAQVFDFDISEADMKELDGFEKVRTSWDPTNIP
jgi:diketogulonate reductase-like aldo/keto reductase